MSTHPTGRAEATELASWRPRIHHTAPTHDPDAAVEAAGALLTALGIDWHTVDMAETPGRMVAAYRELLDPPAFDFTTFPNTEGYDELVLVHDIEFQSLCEHHLLPFVGVAHVGYLPDERIVGLSKLPRLVDFVARAAQTQERLTQSIARHLHAHLRPRGVGVVLEADHTCMTIRGARATGSRTVTSALLGLLRDHPASRSEFLALAAPHRTPRGR